MALNLVGTSGNATIDADTGISGFTIDFDVWTTATRPATPSTGDTGFNSDLNCLETYNGSAWVSQLPSQTGNNGKYLTTNGTSPSWGTISATTPAGSTGQVQYNNAGAFGALSSGTTGQVLTSQGSGVVPAWETLQSAGVDVQTFTSSGTWTKPSSASVCFVIAWGAGGGGARSSSYASGGGGGGACVMAWLPASSLSSTETITIGAGGNAAASANSNGSAGGNTTVGTKVTAYGGGGGGGNSGAARAGGGGGGALSAGQTATGSYTTVGVGGRPYVVFNSSDIGFISTNRFSDNPGFGGGNSIAGGYTDSEGMAGGSSAYGGGSGGSGGLIGTGGMSVYGGGGGGGCGDSASTGGTSLYGGNGGSNSGAGTQPGGGGAAGQGTAGAGAAGKVIIYTWG